MQAAHRLLWTGRSAHRLRVHCEMPGKPNATSPLVIRPPPLPPAQAVKQLLSFCTSKPDDAATRPAAPSEQHEVTVSSLKILQSVVRCRRCSPQPPSCKTGAAGRRSSPSPIQSAHRAAHLPESFHPIRIRQALPANEVAAVISCLRLPDGLGSSHRHALSAAVAQVL